MLGKKLFVSIVVFFVLMASPARAVVIGGPTLTVGGVVFTDLTNLIVLGCSANTTTDYSTCRKPNGIAGYQVTAGKTFTIRAVLACYSIAASTGSQAFQLLYGDNDVGLNAAAAPTTPIREYGMASSSTGVVSLAPNTVAGGTCVAYSDFFQVPAAKYAAVQVSSSIQTMVLLYGYEN